MRKRLFITTTLEFTKPVVLHYIRQCIIEDNNSVIK
jgi:hypothetical protein